MGLCQLPLLTARFKGKRPLGPAFALLVFEAHCRPTTGYDWLTGPLVVDAVHHCYSVHSVIIDSNCQAVNSRRANCRLLQNVFKKDVASALIMQLPSTDAPGVSLLHSHSTLL